MSLVGHVAASWDLRDVFPGFHPKQQLSFLFSASSQTLLHRNGTLAGAVGSGVSSDPGEQMKH